LRNKLTAAEQAGPSSSPKEMLVKRPNQKSIGNLQAAMLLENKRSIYLRFSVSLFLFLFFIIANYIYYRGMLEGVRSLQASVVGFRGRVKMLRGCHASIVW
jgi:hypothetical protein